MALHRKFDAMLRLQPDIAVICECAEPKRIQEGFHWLRSRYRVDR
jgi:hypothetical protein